VVAVEEVWGRVREVVEGKPGYSFPQSRNAKVPALGHDKKRPEIRE
jgi:hypothetical protein